jgi:hypothetical protein
MSSEDFDGPSGSDFWRVVPIIGLIFPFGIPNIGDIALANM